MRKGVVLQLGRWVEINNCMA